jgi:hypothetical protein
MTKDAILSVIRHVLTFGGGIAVSAGYLDNGEVATVVGALVTLIGVGWGVYEKRARA